ncbi:MAG: DNA-binding protein [Clostridia bacterium]|nr:DNA-binding protein [Clostridia bacterium]
MFEKNMKIAYLLDFYGDALDDHIGSVMRAYYNDDLSLAEIAADEGISRQGVRHLIKKGEEQLFFFEEKFGLAKRHGELTQACKLLSEIADTLEAKPDCEKEAAQISDIIGIILKGNQDVSESD